MAGLSHLCDSQKHVTRYWSELNENEQEELANQVATLDLATATKCFHESADIYKADPNNLTPIPADHRIAVKDMSTAEYDKLRQLGLEAVAKGEVCALVLAGGQASRLGSSCPKGCLKLEIGASPCDSLLGLQASQIATLEKLARKEHPGLEGKIQWVVMTSKTTEKATLEHLEKVLPEAGLTKEQLTLFSQSEIPAFDFEGNVFLATKNSVATSPNGNGGIYSALSHHLPELKKRGVKYFHIYCVDNILCKVADPVFIGYAIEQNADVVTKCIDKKVGELVGSVCLDNGKPRVTEYSELGSDLAEKKTESGKFLFGDGSIANHLFTMEFLESFCTPNFHLPYHRAIKKVSHLGENGEQVKPEKTNGIKLEQFIFDVFTMSKDFYIYTVQREDEFAPLKNAESAGFDCLSTCRKALSEQSIKWLKAIGAQPQSSEVYIKAGITYNGENLEHLQGKEIINKIVS